MENGKAALASHLQGGVGCGSTEFHVLRPSHRVLPRWVFYFIRQESFRERGKNNFTGTAGQQRIPAAFLGQVELPVPPLADQHHIVAILDAADELRRLRAEADRRTADLIPALFHDMFGDPKTNPKGWPKIKVRDVLSSTRPGTRCGPFGSALKKAEYVSEGVPVWGIDNVAPNYFVESGSLFITPEKYSQLAAWDVQPGDVLVSRAGTVGRMCVARPQRSPSIIGTNLIRLAFDQDLIVPEYFTAIATYFLVNASSLKANSDKGAYSFVNTSKLASLPIPLPPFDLQREFVGHTTVVGALQESQAQSRHRLDDLFQSLLHRAFSGEIA